DGGEGLQLRVPARLGEGRDGAGAHRRGRNPPLALRAAPGQPADHLRPLQRQWLRGSCAGGAPRFRRCRDPPARPVGMKRLGRVHCPGARVSGTEPPAPLRGRRASRAPTPPRVPDLEANMAEVLAPVAEHKPYVPDEARVAEFTPKAIAVGALFGLIFGASTVYLALKAGLTVSASIPIAVLSISL